jgi:hypothetical protein
LNELDLPKETFIDEVQRAFMLYLEYVLNNGMLPGQIENVVVVIDVNELGIS